MEATHQPLEAVALPAAVQALPRDKVFLAYQASTVALAHAVPLVVVEKSRRIGITWGFAGDDAVTASLAKAEGGHDVLYIGPSFDMAREYVDAVAAFARAYMRIDAVVGETMFDDEDLERPGETRQIKAFRIDFASGHHVLALTSAPRSLRGRQGLVRIDEAAFVDNLPELLKAALALLIWGGRVVVMSTHNGVDNPFNELIQDIRSGKQAGEVVRITFDDAVAMGLYERVCLVSGRKPSEEDKAAWVAGIRAFYGAGASEELDVIPARGGGAWLTHDEIERAERAGIPVLRWELDDEFNKKPDHLRELIARVWCEENLAPLLLKLDPRAPVGIGGDFARRTDLTVIWPFQELQDRSWATPFLIELRNVPITEQIFILRWLLERLRFWKACLDAGGLGLAIAERMQQLFGEIQVQLVNLRAEFWLTEAPPLKARFQDGRATIPLDRDVAADLRGVQVKGGVPYIPEIRINAKVEGAKKGVKRHYDSAVACILASAALRSGAVQPFEAGLVLDRVQGGFEGPSGADNDLFSDEAFGVVRINDGGPNW